MNKVNKTTGELTTYSLPSGVSPWTMTFDSNNLIWFTINPYPTYLPVIYSWNSVTQELLHYDFPLSLTTESPYNWPDNIVFDPVNNSLWIQNYNYGNADQNVVIEFVISTHTFNIIQLPSSVSSYINGSVPIPGQYDSVNKWVWFMGRTSGGDGQVFAVDTITKAFVFNVDSPTSGSGYFYPWQNFKVVNGSAYFAYAGGNYGVKILV
jgi:hypothetical protein